MFMVIGDQETAEECAAYLVEASVKHVAILCGGIQSLMAHADSAEFLVVQDELVEEPGSPSHELRYSI